MPKKHPPGTFRSGVVLSGQNLPRRYRKNQRTAIESFRTVELDEATLRPVNEPDAAPATLRRTSQGAVVIYRKA